MTGKIKDGGPAFPCDGIHSPNGILSSAGMSLRDYFAAKAMPVCYSEYCAHADVQGYVEDWKMGVAMDAYAMADAMLKARAVTGEDDRG